MAQRYTAYVRPTVHFDDGGLTLIKEGFSWPAFLLAVPWALWHRMWIVAAVLVAVQVILATAPGMAGLGEISQGVLSLGLAVAVGLAGSDLRDWSLRRRGFVAADVVLGENRDMAERRFLDNHPQLAADLTAAIRG